MQHIGYLLLEGILYVISGDTLVTVKRIHTAVRDNISGTVRRIQPVIKGDLLLSGGYTLP